MTTVQLLIAQAKWHRACETEAVFAAVESVMPAGKERELIADLTLMLMRMGREDLVAAVLDERMTLTEALAEASAGALTTARERRRRFRLARGAAPLLKK